jgi:hypothetical protein
MAETARLAIIRKPTTGMTASKSGVFHHRPLHTGRAKILNRDNPPDFSKLAKTFMPCQQPVSFPGSNSSKRPRNVPAFSGADRIFLIEFADPSTIGGELLK